LQTPESKQTDLKRRQPAGKSVTAPIAQSSLE